MVVPPARLCTDNGVMVAWAGVERLKTGVSNGVEGQAVYARLPLGGYAEDGDNAVIVSSADTGVGRRVGGGVAGVGSMESVVR